MGLYIKNWSLADWKELLKWAKIGANNAMMGEFTEVEEVPPHGRLGDLDKLENGLRHMAKYQHGERQQGILGCCETIRLAPTIIPEEEGE